MFMPVDSYSFHNQCTNFVSHLQDTAFTDGQFLCGFQLLIKWLIHKAEVTCMSSMQIISRYYNDFGKLCHSTS